MKKLLAITLVAAMPIISYASDTYVQGYTRQDGTYVQPHYRSSPDNNAYNNYSSRGNTNPYTGHQGTRDPQQVQQQYQPSNNNSYNSQMNSGSQYNQRGYR